MCLLFVIILIPIENSLNLALLCHNKHIFLQSHLQEISQCSVCVLVQAQNILISANSHLIYRLKPCYIRLYMTYETCPTKVLLILSQQIRLSKRVSGCGHHLQTHMAAPPYSTTESTTVCLHSSNRDKELLSAFSYTRTCTHSQQQTGGVVLVSHWSDIWLSVGFHLCFTDFSFLTHARC